MSGISITTSARRSEPESDRLSACDLPVANHRLDTPSARMPTRVLLDHGGPSKHQERGSLTLGTEQPQANHAHDPYDVGADPHLNPPWDQAKHPAAHGHTTPPHRSVLVRDLEDRDQGVEFDPTWHDEFDFATQDLLLTQS